MSSTSSCSPLWALSSLEHPNLYFMMRLDFLLLPQQVRVMELHLHLVVCGGSTFVWIARGSGSVLVDLRRWLHHHQAEERHAGPAGEHCRGDHWLRGDMMKVRYCGRQQENGTDERWSVVGPRGRGARGMFRIKERSGIWWGRHLRFGECEQQHWRAAGVAASANLHFKQIVSDWN